MISQEQIKILQELSRTNYGKALREFLAEKMLEIKDVTTCSSYDEVLGRQKALKTLKDLFSFLEERKSVEPSKSQYS